MATQFLSRSIVKANDRICRLMSNSLKRKMKAEIIKDASQKNETFVEVKVNPLDQSIISYKNITSYMNIDTERYQKNILESAARIIDVENQPIIQIELIEVAWCKAGPNREKILPILSDLEYEFLESDKTREICFEKPDLNNCYNVFCLRMGMYRARLGLV